jgi:GTP cyclohydrolase IA
MAQPPPGFDRSAVEDALSRLIRAMGLDPSAEPELKETPARVRSLYEEIFAGLAPANDPELAVFPRPAPSGSAPSEDLVMVRDIPFYSLCVHHFVPFFGHAHVAFLPGETLLGISGVARVLEHFARRPQLQERLGSQVADRLEEVLAPRGVAVVLQARHLCMEMRGIRTPGRVETRVVRGALVEPRWAGLFSAPQEPSGPHVT